jgi:hypothetical protein
MLETVPTVLAPTDSVRFKESLEYRKITTTLKTNQIPALWIVTVLQENSAHLNTAWAALKTLIVPLGLNASLLKENVVISAKSIQTAKQIPSATTILLLMHAQPELAPTMETVREPPVPKDSALLKEIYPKPKAQIDDLHDLPLLYSTIIQSVYQRRKNTYHHD